MQISFDVKNLEKNLKKLGKIQADEILLDGLERLTDLFENKVGLEARNVVYSYRPKTSTYIRTGRLLGGRGKATGGGKPNTQKIDKYTTKVEANPMLKGASFNYAPYVNAGAGWMKRVGPRPFWDISVDWVKKSGLRKVREEIMERIKKITK
jgi:hypothetical protein